MLVFPAFSPAGQQLYQRPMAALEAAPIFDTEGAVSSFVSPDGEWVAFAADGELRRAALGSRSTQYITDLPQSDLVGGTWATDDTLYYGVGDSALWKVPASGGTPEPLTTLDAEAGEAAHVFPRLLPGERALLFRVWSGSLETVRVEAVSLDTGERHPVVDGGIAFYAGTGHVVYTPMDRLSEIWAVPFDVDRLAVTGVPVQILDGVAVTNGTTHFALGADGTLAYIPESSAFRTLVWVDRDGREEDVNAAPGFHRSVRVSPDRRRAVLVVAGPNDDQQSEDIFIHDLDSGTQTRFTFDPGRDTHALWSPDGQWIVFSSDRAGGMNLFRKAADGTGVPEPLTTAGTNRYATSWSADGRTLVHTEQRPETDYDIEVLSLDGARETESLIRTDSLEWYNDVSPDGRWIAYAAVDASGQSEV